MNWQIPARAGLHRTRVNNNPPASKTWNLETTSGAGFTRDEHYRTITPMTDEAIANGVYLKTLSRREALSIIAAGVLDHLLATGRYDEAIAVADVLIDAYPANVYALVKKGTAYYRLLDRDFIRKYPKKATFHRPSCRALSRSPAPIRKRSRRPKRLAGANRRQIRIYRGQGNDDDVH